MTPQEKAENIIKRFYDPYLTNTDMENAKRCARISVDEIIFLLSNEPPRPSNGYQTSIFWQEVKEEIEKI